MRLESWISSAKEAGASDLHLEGGMPPTLRIRGALKMVGEPLSPETLTQAARELLGTEGWEEFRAQRSHDLSVTLAGVRCRINVLQSARGVGMAIRLLTSFQATLRKLNLHPSLRKLIEHRHGLILISGPTGSGKSSTLAALIQEINLAESRHIVTIESPIEYVLQPRLSLIRQREVGRHTPSVDQALLDALREDPDVLMVGEMRDPETMRLTLNAAETGHLVLATLHSSTAPEALQRLVGAFAPEIRGAVQAQLADCLVAVVCQRLRYREREKMLVPEAEILMGTSATKSLVRQGMFFKLGTAMESGGQDGSMSLQRYQEWLDAKTDWVRPEELERESVPQDFAVKELPRLEAPPPPAPTRPAPVRTPVTRPEPRASQTVSRPPPPETPPGGEPGVIVIDEAESPDEILTQLNRRK